MDDFSGGVHLDVVQGETFQLPVSYTDDNATPINLTGYTARMQARKTVGADNPPLFDLTTGNGAIIIDGVNGYLDILIPATETKNFPAGWDGVFDLFLTSSIGVVIKLLEGTVHVKGRVTHE